MCAISSWATCGSGQSRERRLKTSNESKNHVEEYIDNCVDGANTNKCSSSQSNTKYGIWMLIAIL